MNTDPRPENVPKRPESPGSDPAPPSGAQAPEPKLPGLSGLETDEGGSESEVAEKRLVAIPLKGGSQHSPEEGRVAPKGPAEKVVLVDFAARVEELARVRADERIQDEFAKLSEAAAQQGSGWQAYALRILRAPFRKSTYKALALRATSESRRLRYIDEERGDIEEEFRTGAPGEATLKRLQELSGDKDDFGARRLDEKNEKLKQVERLLSQYKDEGGLDKERVLSQCVEVLGDVNSLRLDGISAYLDKVDEQRYGPGERSEDLQPDIQLWQESAVVQRRDRGALEKLVEACHRNKVLASISIPGVAASITTTVAIAVWAAKGGLGIRQLATSFGAGLAVGGLFSYFRKGRELRDDREHIQTLKALGEDRVEEQKLSQKDKDIRRSFINVDACLGVGQAIKVLDAFTEHASDRKGFIELARYVGKVECALEMANFEEDTGVHVLQYSSKKEIAQERLDLMTALVIAKKTLTDAQTVCPDLEIGVLEKSRKTSKADFETEVIEEAERIRKEFRNYRRIEQLKSAGTTILTGSVIGAVFFGLSQGVQAGVSGLSALQAPPAEDLLSADGTSDSIESPESAPVKTENELVETPPDESVPAAPPEPPEPSQGSEQKLEGGDPPPREAVVRRAESEPAENSPGEGGEPERKPPEPLPALESVSLPFDRENPPAGVYVEHDGSFLIKPHELDEQTAKNIERWQKELREKGLEDSVKLEERVLQEAKPEQIAKLSITDAFSDEVEVIASAKSEEIYITTGSGKIDGNQQELHWGGRHRSGLTEDGGIEYSLDRMKDDQSFVWRDGKKVFIDVPELIAQPGEEMEVEMILRLDKDNPDNVVRIPVNEQGKIQIPTEVKEAAYRVEDGRAVYRGWQAQVGVRFADGTFAEIATDFGERELDGATVEQVIPAQEELREIRFQPVEQEEVSAGEAKAEMKGNSEFQQEEEGEPVAPPEKREEEAEEFPDETGRNDRATPDNVLPLEHGGFRDPWHERLDQQMMAANAPELRNPQEVQAPTLVQASVLPSKAFEVLASSIADSVSPTLSEGTVFLGYDRGRDALSSQGTPVEFLRKAGYFRFSGIGSPQGCLWRQDLAKETSIKGKIQTVRYNLHSLQEAFKIPVEKREELLTDHLVKQSVIRSGRVFMTPENDVPEEFEHHIYVSRQGGKVFGVMAQETEAKNKLFWVVDAEREAPIRLEGEEELGEFFHKFGLSDPSFYRKRAWIYREDELY